MAVVLMPVLSWACFLIFLAGVAIVWRRYSRMPLHLRWDLHPLPGEATASGANEAPGRVWPALAEVRFALREGLFFGQCFKANRGLWYASYPFHLGVFAVILWAILVTLLAVVGPAGSWPIKAASLVVLVSGGAGFMLGVAGGIGLLAKRLFDPGLRLYTTPREYANLGILLAVFLLGLTTWITSDFDFSLSRQHVHSLIAFTAPPSGGWLFRVTSIVFPVFLATLPFGSMRHGIAKFFTYHQVRWDNEPNFKGSEMERRIVRSMTNPLTWSASHIGCTSWKDVPGRGAGDNQ